MRRAGTHSRGDKPPPRASARPLSRYSLNSTCCPNGDGRLNRRTKRSSATGLLSTMRMNSSCSASSSVITTDGRILRNTSTSASSTDVFTSSTDTTTPPLNNPARARATQTDNSRINTATTQQLTSRHRSNLHATTPTPTRASGHHKLTPRRRVHQSALPHRARNRKQHGRRARVVLKHQHVALLHARQHITVNHARLSVQ